MAVGVWHEHVGRDFVWDGSRFLMNWETPTAVAAVYLSACAMHNIRLARRAKQGSAQPFPLLDAVSVTHNAILVSFSAIVFIAAGFRFVAVIEKTGLRSFLCPPMHPPSAGLAGFFTLMLSDGSDSAPQLPPPLAGELHYWCYVFYLSKYYELLDTLLLMLRGKPVIFLHAMHHAFIPLVMVVLFEGRVSVSLVGLTCLNSLVHVVMYAYFLASALGWSPPIIWKMQVTRLQILQFSAGVVGGTSYWLMYFRKPRIEFDGNGASHWLPRLQYEPGCDGGDPHMVLVGYLVNCLLLCLFLRFYKDAYSPRRRRADKVR